MKLIPEQEIKIHPISYKKHAFLFYYNDFLFRATNDVFAKCFDIISKINSNYIQYTEKTDYYIDNKYKDVYKHKKYNHLIRIQETPITRIKDFIKTICYANIDLIKNNYIISDIHEGNINDTINKKFYTTFVKTYL